MGILDSAKRLLHIAAVTGTIGAATEGVSEAKSVEHPHEMTPHAEIQLSPTKAFEVARTRAIDLINNSKNDAGSFGDQSDANWRAKLVDGGKGGLPILEITVRSGGKEVVKRYQVVRGETTDATSKIIDNYSFETAEDGTVLDIDEQDAAQQAHDAIASASGTHPSGSGPAGAK